MNEDYRAYQVSRIELTYAAACEAVARQLMDFDTRPEESACERARRIVKALGWTK